MPSVRRVPPTCARHEARMKERLCSLPRLYLDNLLDQDTTCTPIVKLPAYLICEPKLTLYTQYY